MTYSSTQLLEDCSILKSSYEELIGLAAYLLELDFAAKDNMVEVQTETHLKRSLKNHMSAIERVGNKYKKTNNLDKKDISTLIYAAQSLEKLNFLERAGMMEAYLRGAPEKILHVSLNRMEKTLKKLQPSSLTTGDFYIK